MNNIIIPITQGRKELFKIVDKVQRPGTYYTFTIGGKPQVVLISKEEFDSMIETLDILSDPKAMKAIEKSEKEIEKGEYYVLEKARHGSEFDTTQFIVRDEAKNKYAV